MNGVTISVEALVALQRYAVPQGFRKGRALAQVGQHLSTIRGRGMDFAEARNYQAGDDVRHMEWRVTARTGRPHVKVYQEERERPVMLLVDFSNSMYFGTKKAFKSVIAAQLAAIIAWSAVRQGDRVGGFLCTESRQDEFTPRLRRAGVLPFLSGLSEYTSLALKEQPADKPHHFNHTLRRLRHVTKPGSVVVLISDGYGFDEQTTHHLSRLAFHNDVMLYLVLDPVELAPPRPGQYALTDMQHSLLWDVHRKATRLAYQERCDARIAEITQGCARLGVGYAIVSSEADLPQTVHETLTWRPHVAT